jgi:hypothetical protein
MHWEVWALNTGNLIATPATEDEALKLVGELLDSGYRAEELSLGMEDDNLPVEGLPTPLEGAELAERMREAQYRRSA